jgi:hypothetical protein
MNIGNIFITLYVLWHFNNYGTPKYLYLLYQKLYFFLQEYHELWNKVLKPDYFKIEDKSIDQKPEYKPKPQVKYEDKYLEEIRKMDKEYLFTEEEQKTKEKKLNEIFNVLIKEKREKFEICKRKVEEIYKKIKEYKNSDDIHCLINDNEEDEMDFSLCVTKEDIIKKLEKELDIAEEEEVNYRLLLETDDGVADVKKEAEEAAHIFMVQERLNKLAGCNVMEYTPQGNVLLTYDLDRGSFKYYSDNTIPYRYLETVARKYVKQFNCRPIFVDMEEELKLAEEKWNKEKEEEKIKVEKEKREKEEALKQNKQPVEEKKNVFAKFKSYNKEAGTGKVSSAAPPKNSIPNQKITEKQENEKILLKEKANRYTYEGKMANFSFIKKVDRKIVDKKYAMSFADFKKMQKEKK